MMGCCSCWDFVFFVILCYERSFSPHTTPHGWPDLLSVTQWDWMCVVGVFFFSLLPSFPLFRDTTPPHCSVACLIILLLGEPFP
jgi:hypothetical protein